MSPAETALLMKILMGAGVLFVIGYIGNRISFSNRFVNALVTALVFAVVYGTLTFTVDTATLPPELRELNQQTWWQMIAMSSALVFVIDLIANMLSFSNRLINALMTAIVFAALFAFLMYATGGVPTTAA